jgi:hypothetical protein
MRFNSFDNIRRICTKVSEYKNPDNLFTVNFSSAHNNPDVKAYLIITVVIAPLMLTSGK